MSKGYYKITPKEYTLGLVGLSETIGLQQHLEGLSFTNILDNIEKQEKDLREQGLIPMADTAKVLLELATELRVFRAKCRTIVEKAPLIKVEKIEADQETGPTGGQAH